MKQKEASFFGGAMRDTTTKEYKDSVLIGGFLAEKGYIVNNGGYGGLMEAVSKGVAEAGGEVYGWTCETFGKGKGNKYLTEEHRQPDIYKRLRYLIGHDESSSIFYTDVFVVQKGGIGTLAELFLAWDVFRKNKTTKTRIYLIGEHWNAILTALEPVTSEKEMKLIIVCEDFEDFKIKFKE